MSRHPSSDLILNVSVSKPKNFDKIMARFKAKGDLDGYDFGNAAELGTFIDFYNDTKTANKDKHAANEMKEISKFLARIQGRTTFTGKSS